MSGLEALSGAFDAVVTRPDPAVTGVALYTLALVFGLAAITKLRNPDRFAAALVEFGIGSVRSRRRAIAVAIVEVIVVLALVVPASAALAAAAATALLVFFALLIGRSLLRGAEFACGCFGSYEREISASTVWRALALVAVGLTTTVWAFQIQLTAPSWTTAVSESGAALALLSGAVLVSRGWEVRALNRSWAAGYRAMLRAS